MSSGRDLSRRRSGRYGAPETGRHHHLGGAPERQPLLAEDGVEFVETSQVQLAERTLHQLRMQRARHERLMAAAADALDFEEAARQRDAVAAVDAEIARR